MNTEVAGTAILTLDPAKYVAAVYAPFNERLTAALAITTQIKVVDTSTPKALTVATKHRAMLRAIRIEADKARETRKAPILAIGNLLQKRYKEIEAQVDAEEDRFDVAIKAEEKRRADAAIAEERRVQAIQSRIAQIAAAPAMLNGATSTVINDAMLTMLQDVPSEWASEFTQEAADAQECAAQALVVMYGKALTREAEEAQAAAKRAADMAELERLRKAEAERLRKEREEEQAERDAADTERRLLVMAAESAPVVAIARNIPKGIDTYDALAGAVPASAPANTVVGATRSLYSNEARENEVLHGQQILANFMKRFGAMAEFAEVAPAINEYLSKQG